MGLNSQFTTVCILVGSKGAIMPRSSLLDLDVRLSVHPAPDSIRQCLCTCERNRGMTHAEPPDCCISSFGDFHLCGAGEPAPPM